MVFLIIDNAPVTPLGRSSAASHSASKRHRLQRTLRSDWRESARYVDLVHPILLDQAHRRVRLGDRVVSDARANSLH
jgi:hypothetical protein